MQSPSVNASVDLTLEVLKINKQVLIFVESKKAAERLAEELAKSVKKLKLFSLDDLSRKIYKALPSPTEQCIRLASCIKFGVAFHHAGLLSKQRELIEDNYRSGHVKVICCTPTLAFGVDTPAFRVIIKNLKRYGGAWGMNWIPTLEYLQMAGRAGRPNFHDDYGEAIAVAKNEAESDEIYGRYVTGEPEDITSKLAVEPVLRTYILSLIATGFARTRSQLLNFFSKTFWAFHYKDLNKLAAIIDKMIKLLQSWNFIEVPKNDDFVVASELNSEKVVTATLLGKRVAELYIDPYTANHLIKGLLKSKYAKQFAMLQMVSHTLEMRPLLNVKSNDAEMINETIIQNDLLGMEPTIYDPTHDEFEDSVKTALFFNDWVEEKGEEYLFKTYGIRPGEIHAKITIADWLLYAAEELCPLLKLNSTEVRKLRVRVKYGVKEELMPLLKLENIGRVRARKLCSNGLKDIGDIKKMDLASLSSLIGDRTALKVKKQLGQELNVKIGNRKGQMSLGKY